MRVYDAAMSTSERVKRFLALTLTLLIVLPLSLVAARWQWERHQERSARNALVAAAEASAVVPLTDVLSATGGLPAAREWRRVETSGRFRDGSQRLWRKQPLDGRPGFVVVAIFEPEVGKPFVVERGWIAANGAEPSSSPTAFPLSGEVTLTGYVRPLPLCEGADPGDLPAGQTNCPRTLLAAGDGDFRVQAAAAAEPLTALPLPELDPGPHLGYVGQWLLIGLTAIVTYVSLLRRLGDELTPAR